MHLREQLWRQLKVMVDECNEKYKNKTTKHASVILLSIEPVVLICLICSLLCTTATFSSYQCCLSLLSQMILCIVRRSQKSLSKQVMTQLNMLIFPALDADSWASCFARSKVDSMLIGTVEQCSRCIVFFVLQYTHCNFYC